MPITATQIQYSDLGLPKDTYIYSLARLQGSCASISSDDTLTFFDDASLTVAYQVKGAHAGLTCLVPSSDASSAVTAGRDGLIKTWDPRSRSATNVLRVPQDAGFSALGVNGTYVAAGTESTKEGLGNVSVLLWDTRQPSTPVRNYKESHTDTITQLRFHPTSSSVLMSAATDGLVSIFDTTIDDEDDALTQVLNHAAAVHCAGFYTADQVYAISTDEQLSLYTLAKPDDKDEDTLPVTVLGDVRERLDSSYVVDLIHSSRSASWWIASGDSRPDDSFDTANNITFKGAHGEEVVRDVMLDEVNQRVMTCGEDGHVRLWSVPDGKPSREEKRSKKFKTADKNRYKPY